MRSQSGRTSPQPDRADTPNTKRTIREYAQFDLRQLEGDHPERAVARCSPRMVDAVAPPAETVLRRIVVTTESRLLLRERLTANSATETPLVPVKRHLAFQIDNKFHVAIPGVRIQPVFRQNLFSRLVRPPVLIFPQFLLG